MAEVFKLGIAADNNQPIMEVHSIEVLANKGIVGDRHFHDFNDPYNQLSLIEAENIDEYNIKFGLDIPYINFRRNIVTKGIQLNDLIGKKLKNDNIYFAGIDFIDQKLNGDINVTSPTGLKTYYDLSKINLAKIFWKGLRA